MNENTLKTKHWKVEGMSCATCVQTVSGFLKKAGMQNVKVSLLDGDISFDTVTGFEAKKLVKGIEELGYGVRTDEPSGTKPRKRFLPAYRDKFLFCLLFTLPLWSHMWVHIHWLMDAWVQLSLTLPVFILGLWHFGRSAWRSIRNGLPNMNVLITLGTVSAFAYSLFGLLTGQADKYLFFETSATIITLVFFGEFLEQRSIASTQKALNALAKNQKVMANMIAFDDQYKEQVFPVENTQLRVGDLILIRTGEQVPIDSKILWGECTVNESIITGESTPVTKRAKGKLIGGSVLENGTVKAQVTAVGDDTVLSGILNMVKKAQGEKPPMQKLADKISAVFVPVVAAIAVLTLLLNLFVGHFGFTESLMRTIAVLVIACPCAMGLATPAAIAVGLGRGARQGILFRNAGSLELFKDIKQVVFDKTGTLTTGKLQISEFSIQHSAYSEEDFIQIVYSLEKYSTHPVAVALANACKRNNEIRWKKIEEIKGQGMVAEDKEGNIFKLGSYKMIENISGDKQHSIYVVKNNDLLGWIDLKDELRPEAKEVVSYLHHKGIKTLLVSGDGKEKCAAVAKELGIDEVYAEQSPQQKLDLIDQLNKTLPTAMVGDGINDGPALAKASIGISMSDATELAVQSAQVVLMNKGLKNLPAALGLGKHTYQTIRTNLFWAFIYNIVAIPVAAFGLLTPNLSALAMGFSDVVLALNSTWLFFKRVV
jgi:Cu+-exporting ATPase